MSPITWLLLAIGLAFCVGFCGWCVRTAPSRSDEPQDDEGWLTYERDLKNESRRNLERIARNAGR